MTLNELRDEIFANAEKHGFHKNKNFGESLMLVVSELSEALEADRNGKWRRTDCTGVGCDKCPGCNGPLPPKDFERLFKGTVEEEIADAIIRLFDIAGVWEINLDWWIKSKMAYNETRPYKHGKKY